MRACFTPVQALVQMENLLLRWMNDLVGYPATASGNLTTSGSLANLIAVVVARDAKGIRSRDVERSVIYLSRQTHHSVDKAIRVAGLGECVVDTASRRALQDHSGRAGASDRDEQGRRPESVPRRRLFRHDRCRCHRPAARDRRDAKRHDLWYHIDAAYGGFFILTDEGREKLQGLELSDSLIIDPHKGLFLPYGLGVVLVKNVEDLKRSFRFDANYMQDAFVGPDEFSPAELSPELTKHFRGLRLWLPLKLHGIAPFRACFEEKLLLAKYFHGEVQKLGFVSGLEPELSVVVYRYEPKSGDADAFNKNILEAVVADGRVFISSTVLNGKYTLRFACLAFRTHLSTVDLLLEILALEVDRLQRS